MRKSILVSVVLGLAACDNSALPEAPPPPPAGPKIVVTALVREFDPVATKHDATWVAVERTPAHGLQSPRSRPARTNSRRPASRGRSRSRARTPTMPSHR